MLLLCAFFNQHNSPALSPSAESPALIALAMSNQNIAPWLPGSFHREQNSLPAERFEWTNRSGSTLSNRSILAPKRDSQ